MVRIYNDFESCKVKANLPPGPAGPGHRLPCLGALPVPRLEALRRVTPGMIKWLHMAGGYGHLNYWRWNWSPAVRPGHAGRGGEGLRREGLR